MKLTVSPDRTVQELKSEFHGYFPFLKIEFFSKPHGTGGSSNRADMADGSTKLADLMGDHAGGSVEFSALTTVHSLEQEFSNAFGLHMQVFRKSGNVYLETNTTDDWTLGQQNAEGKNSGKPAGEESPRDLTDRDQWE